MTLFSDGNETKDNTNSLSSIFISTTALYTNKTLKRTLTENKSTVSSNVNLTPFTTEHSASQMGRIKTSQTKQPNMLTTILYSVTTNIAENCTNFSKKSTKVVPMSTVNNTTLPLFEPNSISNSDDAAVISTQSDIETDLVNSTLKLSTASIDSSGLSTFSMTEKNIGKTTLDQSTKFIGQNNKPSVNTYQPTDTTMYHESGKEDISNPFTDKIDVLTVTAAIASTVIVVISVIIFIVIRKRRRQRKAHAEGNGNHFELGARQPNTANENRSYEEPWGYLKTINTGIRECQIYDEVKDLDSFERQIYDEATNQYQHLDFDLQSKQPKFLEAEYDSSIATLPFPKSDINKTSTNSAKNKSARENVAYCDTAIVHTKYLYDTPKQATRHVSKP
ncbi:unnamed protein product [Mytilus coruscus]|uniref:Uncharacterized protein n=1 Tax=Mytilus coruscus TaxID=42192 RepID=A0A6J8ETR3_MYTCO|nr:unnamed protein product [Mytilus coruscus]